MKALELFALMQERPFLYIDYLLWVFSGRVEDSAIGYSPAARNIEASLSSVYLNFCCQVFDFPTFFDRLTTYLASLRFPINSKRGRGTETILSSFFKEILSHLRFNLSFESHHSQSPRPTSSRMQYRQFTVITLVVASITCVLAGPLERRGVLSFLTCAVDCMLAKEEAFGERPSHV